MRQEFKEQVYKQYLQDRTIILNQDFTDEMIELVVLNILSFNEEDDEREEQLTNYKREDSPITIVIHSYGGSIFDCLSVISAIKTSRTPVHTLALGKVMSAGFYTLVAGHKRFAQKYSTLMYHQIAYRKNYDKLVGHIEEAEVGLKLQATLDEIVVEDTKIPMSKLNEVNFSKSDWYMTAKEALELGVIDEII